MNTVDHNSFQLKADTMELFPYQYLCTGKSRAEEDFLDGESPSNDDCYFINGYKVEFENVQKWVDCLFRTIDIKIDVEERRNGYIVKGFYIINNKYKIDIQLGARGLILACLALSEKGFIDRRYVQLSRLYNDVFVFDGNENLIPSSWQDTLINTIKVERIINDNGKSVETIVSDIPDLVDSIIRHVYQDYPYWLDFRD